MKPKVIWEDLPSKGTRRKCGYKLPLDAMREHPGRWARVAVYVTSNSAASCADQYRKGPLGSEFEFRARTTVEGEFVIYARARPYGAGGEE